MTTTLSPDARTFTAADRCDRCGARAYVRASLPSGGELTFCRHHAHEYAPRLRELASDIVEDGSAPA